MPALGLFFNTIVRGSLALLGCQQQISEVLKG